MKKGIEIVNRGWKSEGISGYFAVIVLTFLASVFVRILFAVLFSFSNIPPNDFFVAQLVGIYTDFSFLSLYLFLIAPFYLILFQLKRKLADVVILLILTGYVVLEIMLAWYFSISLVPLTYQNLAGVSNEQALQVAEIYGFHKSQLFFLIPIIIIGFFALWKCRKFAEKTFLKKYTGLIFLIVLISSCFFKVQSSGFDNELNYQVSTNKLSYFIVSHFTYSKEKWQLENTEIDAELKTFYSLNGITDKKNYEYPFYSNEPLSNPLGSFFPKKDTAPNVVFIICESLGRQFSGEDARLGSFTPFLDSLADQSLYWSNFMANAERTFGALPNLLAGLPEGKSGFMNLKQFMPDHLSLPQLLKEKNGYQTAFFCGALKQFDHMDQFLMTQKFDLITGKHNFRSNLLKTEMEDANGNKKYFNWGAEDQVVFDQSFDLIDSAFSKTKPYFNVYLTTSFHEPFNYSQKPVFMNRVKERVKSLKPLHEAEYLNELETFAALMYMDEALKLFFEKYKTRDDFGNTIFVICGDHSIKFMSNDTRLEKFHVPLLIYSPMLKESKRIKSMACHKDVPPALQALLKENFGLTLPDFSISQSDNLRTGEHFSADNVNHVLMFADKSMNSYVWKDYLLMDGALFRISDNLRLEKQNNPELTEAISKRLTNYRLISNFVCAQNRVIPVSVAERFSSAVFLLKSKIDFEQRVDLPETVFRQNLVTNEKAFSGKGALSNKGEQYLNLLKNYSVQGDRRLRLKVHFVIHSKTGNLPTLIIYRKVVSAGGHEKEVDLQKILLDESHSGLTETEKPDWFLVEAGYWFDHVKNFSGEQKIGFFLFTQNEAEYFVDDLEIELRQF